ncbi:MAG: class I SAM-dependent methyltransferase [Rhizobiales bacterium]|nr:class I SAM-dependent methyltransferase [Hyphomicrobiales bacterium]
MDPQQEQTARTFDGYKDSYSEAVDSVVAFTGFSVDFFTRVKADYILDLTREELGNPGNLSVLDVGCGIGNYHPLLSPHFGTLAGVDVSSACVDTARRRNPAVGYQVYDGERLPYDSASFDLAFTICVMHHVPPAKWRGFVGEMRRVLRPGGLALVFEHNPYNPLTRRAVNTCPFDADAVLLRSRTTKALLREAGFDGIRARYILSVPPTNRLLRRVDRGFGLLPFGGQYYVMATA